MSDELYKSRVHGDWKDESYKPEAAGYAKKESDEFIFKFFATTLTAVACIVYVISKN